MNNEKKYEPSSFWLCTFGLYFPSSMTFAALSPAPESPYQSQIVVEQFRAGGPSDNDSKGMYSDFHRRLEKCFPDWEKRMVYQEKQA